MNHPHLLCVTDMFNMHNIIKCISKQNNSPKMIHIIVDDIQTTYNCTEYKHNFLSSENIGKTFYRMINTLNKNRDLFLFVTGAAIYLEPITTTVFPTDTALTITELYPLSLQSSKNIIKSFKMNSNNQQIIHDLWIN